MDTACLHLWDTLDIENTIVIFIILKILFICPWKGSMQLRSALVIVFSLRRIIAAILSGWHRGGLGAVYGPCFLL